MSDGFNAALAFVLAHEGGFSDHPNDPGGATNKGVTLATFSRFLGREATVAELKRISDARVSEIYRAGYWVKAACDRWPPAAALLVFDAAVNQGPRAAIEFLQRAVKVKADGVVGPLTRAAVEKAAARDLAALVDEIAARRMAHYGSLSTFGTFGLGWSRRLMAAHGRAREIAAAAGKSQGDAA